MGRDSHRPFSTEVPYEFRKISGTLNHMTEKELLEHALEIVRELYEFIASAYSKHDHDADIIGGALLSSAKMFTKAVEESLIAILMHLNQKGK
jgi:uncharacterized protein with FMN-binding domain